MRSPVAVILGIKTEGDLDLFMRTFWLIYLRLSLPIWIIMLGQWSVSR
jgi:hypothetical protein